MIRAFMFMFFRVSWVGGFGCEPKLQRFRIGGFSSRCYVTSFGSVCIDFCGLLIEFYVGPYRIPHRLHLDRNGSFKPQSAAERAFLPTRVWGLGVPRAFALRETLRAATELAKLL